MYKAIPELLGVGVQEEEGAVERVHFAFPLFLLP